MIKDRNLYVEQMNNSISEKLNFFSSAPHTDAYIDFGCAEGELLRRLSANGVGSVHIGYDKCKKMIKAAQQNHDNKNISFYEDLDKVYVDSHRIRNSGKTSTLIFSSVFHEIFHYCDAQELHKLFSSILSLPCDRIMIRDMVDDSLLNYDADKSTIQSIRKNAPINLLYDFEKLWGKIKTQKQLLHFLLKYKYENNWDYENKENYFSFLEKRLTRWLENSYKLTINVSYIPEFIQKSIMDDYGIEINDFTHKLLIYEKTQ